jgi:hypothetical protein
MDTCKGEGSGYTKSMPITSKTQNNFKDEDGKEKEALEFSFTNGAREQIKELGEYFKQSSELETIKLAISLLQRLKEQQESSAK